MKKNIIAEALLDMAKNSTTKVVECAEDVELINAASKLGIVVPSPDLAILKTVYAEIDKVNRNGVVLPRKAVEEGLPTLIGKQVNWEHVGSGQICGYTIDAAIKDDKIEIIAVVFKSLFPEEFDIVKERFNEGTLSVSFEIWNRNPDTGESVVKDLENGEIEISPIIFHGTGLLLTSAPACPKAQVYKLLAKEIDNLTDKVFTEDLVYAKLAVAEPKCCNCGTCHCGEKEEKIVDELKIEEVKVEEAVVEAAKVLCPECQEPLKDEECADNLCAVCKNKKVKSAEEITVEETKVEAEVKPEEVAKTTPEETKVEAEVKPELVVEEAGVQTRTVEVVETIATTQTEQVGTTEVKESIVVTDDVGKVVETIVKEEKEVRTFTFEELEAEVAKAKSEIQTIVEEKDKEIAKLKQELESKSQEIVKASVEETVQPDLTVGSVTASGNDIYKERQAGVNLKAYGHR